MFALESLAGNRSTALIVLALKTIYEEDRFGISMKAFHEVFTSEILTKMRKFKQSAADLIPKLRALKSISKNWNRKALFKRQPGIREATLRDGGKVQLSQL